MSSVQPSAPGSVPKAGKETRNQILPTMSLDGSGFVLPNYDFAGQIPSPDKIGVSRGDSIGHVLDAAKGVVQYSDVIGFGQSSGAFTEGMPFQVQGINFFLPSGLQCSNGADMWSQFQGIPDGTALGQRIKAVLDKMKLPAMRGLAPGIIEDVKWSLDPKPVLQAAFGNVYPVCQKVSLPVGDTKGNTQDKVTGDKWVKGPVTQGNDGLAQQERWVQATDNAGKPIQVTQDEFRAAPKTQNPDGTPKAAEGFTDPGKASLLVAVVLFCAAIALTARK